MSASRRLPKRLGKRIGGPDAGFTFVGTLVVLAIAALGVLGTAATAYIESRREAEAQLLFIGDQYRQALAAFSVSAPLGGARFPSDLADLLKDPRYPVARRYLRELYPDPITGRTDWVLIRDPAGGIVGLHSLSQRRPLKIAGFAPPYEVFAGQETYAAWVFTVLAPGAFQVTPAPSNR
jgi:type II secretory pathway pseudopilin PulG